LIVPAVATKKITTGMAVQIKTNEKKEMESSP